MAKQKAKHKSFSLALVIAGISIVILYFIASNRMFSHLVVWTIEEPSGRQIYSQNPESLPVYFRFSQAANAGDSFKNDLRDIVEPSLSQWPTAVAIAVYLDDLIASGKDKHRLRWDSPQGMLRQVKAGSGANCFVRSVLFCSYLASKGMKCRLWALENSKFDGISHTIVEVYCDEFKKWVFIDIMSGLYATYQQGLVSFLELRDHLLRQDSIEVHHIKDIPGQKYSFPENYKKLVACAFLRANNDFAGSFPRRFGRLAFLSRILDKLPDGSRRGLSYFLNGDIFLHYVDEYSPSLKKTQQIAKALFYLAVFSLGIILFCVFLAKAKAFHK